MGNIGNVFRNADVAEIRFRFQLGSAGDVGSVRIREGKQ
jgi:hypothetical protein